MDVSDVDHKLQQKLGAVRDRSGHHVFFYQTIDGKEHLVAKMSHSWRGQLDKTQIKMLADGLRLQLHEFELFVDCAESAEQVIKKFLARPPVWMRT